MHKKQTNQQPTNQQPAGGMEPLNPRDDALFEALGKSRKQKKHKLLRTILIAVLAVAIVLVAGVSILQRRVRDRFSAMENEVLRYQAATGTISTVVSGSGTLTNVDTQTVTVPTGVEIGEILVSFGDTVREGSLLATADMATVKTAMSDLQTQIESLDSQIRDAEDDTVGTYVKAGVSGRVKMIYAEEGEEVAGVMVDHGALAVLSLDGFMAADVETDTLSTGDNVTAILADGEEVSGTVESAAAGKATVLISDDGPLYGEKVTVLTEDGTEAGTGTLYIHNPLSVTGYAGTVRQVSIRENQKVYSGANLFTLTDTGTGANYDALLRTRAEAEETLLELLNIQRSGGITAPISGSIFSVTDMDSVQTVTEVAAISPDVHMSVTITVDEADILSLALDQQADVTVSSVSEDVLTGTVTEIDKTATFGYYTAVITLDKTPGMLQGMTASVDVRIEGVDNAILIPVEALHQTSTGYYVYTAYDEETQQYGGRADVTVGLRNSSFVEIKSGLREGDAVYYTETMSLFDMFNAMSGMGGGRGQMNGDSFSRDDFSGEMPGGNFSGGEMPDMGGQRPQMPGGFGG